MGGDGGATLASPIRLSQQNLEGSCGTFLRLPNRATGHGAGPKLSQAESSVQPGHGSTALGPCTSVRVGAHRADPGETRVLHRATVPCSPRPGKQSAHPGPTRAPHPMKHAPSPRNGKPISRSSTTTKNVGSNQTLATITFPPFSPTSLPHKRTGHRGKEGPTPADLLGTAHVQSRPRWGQRTQQALVLQCHTASNPVA